MNQGADQGFSIGYIARLSNLSPHTIRAWERRYCAVTPLRTKGGTRRYSEADLARLQLLKAAVEGGNRISDIVHLNDAEVSDLVRGSTSGRLSCENEGPNYERTLVDPRAIDTLIEHARSFDAWALEAHLNVQYRLLGPSTFRRELCCTLLHKMGNLWELGELPVAVEHLISTAVKKILLRVFDDKPAVEGAPKIFFTTPDAEYHELGLLIAAGVASDARAESIILGPRLPAEAIVQAVEVGCPNAIALSTVSLSPGEQRAYLKRLRSLLPSGVQIWLGGAMAVGDVPGCTRMSLDEMILQIEALRGV